MRNEPKKLYLHAIQRYRVKTGVTRFMLSVYLIVMGLLLGYLAERQKKLSGEKDIAARMLRWRR